jgi:hypothetical protein
MGLINKNRDQDPQMLPQRQRLENRYASSRHNILLVLIFTTINLILLVANSNTYFVFSAYIPYAIVSLGMFLCGRYPEDYYTDIAEFDYLPTSLLVITLVAAVVICILYLLCWLFSDKKRVGWMITALVLFATDTLMMLLDGIGLDSIIDIIFHGWVIVSLSMGTAAYFKLKKLPTEEEDLPEEPVTTELP